MESTRRKVVRLKNTPEQPLTEREIVEATISFANGAVLEIEGLVPDESGRSGDEKLKGDFEFVRELSKLKPKYHGNLPDDPADMAPRHREVIGELKEFWETLDTTPLARDFEEYLKQYHGTIRRRLADHLRNRRAVARFLLDLRLEGAGVIPLRPVLRETPKGLLFSHYYAFSTYHDLVMVGELLLADDERGYAEKLCQCQLSSCGDIFFEKRPATGRPQRKYCCRAHMLRAHDENASARMAKRARARRGK